MRLKKDKKTGEKVVHYIENQYIREYLTPIKLFFMHNLSSNFCLFLDITKSVFKSSIDSNGNFKFYPRLPKLSDCEIIALSFISAGGGMHAFPTALSITVSFLSAITLLGTPSEVYMSGTMFWYQGEDIKTAIIFLTITIYFHL